MSQKVHLSVYPADTEWSGWVHMELQKFCHRQITIFVTEGLSFAGQHGCGQVVQGDPLKDKCMEHLTGHGCLVHLAAVHPSCSPAFCG